MILSPQGTEIGGKFHSDWRGINLDELYELLQKMKEKPELYFGRKSLARLYSFLNGYGACLSVYDKSYMLCPGAIPGFQEYVQKEYRVKSSQSWDMIVDFYSNSEEQALNTFFDLLDKFLKASKEKS
jgi:hypothetical protein